MQMHLEEEILIQFHMNYLCTYACVCFTLIKQIKLKENFPKGRNMQLGRYVFSLGI